MNNAWTLQSKFKNRISATFLVIKGILTLEENNEFSNLIPKRKTIFWAEKQSKETILFFHKKEVKNNYGVRVNKENNSLNWFPCCNSLW